MDLGGGLITRVIKRYPDLLCKYVRWGGLCPFVEHSRSRTLERLISHIDAHTPCFTRSMSGESIKSKTSLSAALSAHVPKETRESHPPDRQGISNSPKRKLGPGELSERKRIYRLTRSLFETKVDELEKCDECDSYCIASQMHEYTSRWNTLSFCPSCDLPTHWQLKLSDRHERMYFVCNHGPNVTPKTPHTQWGHPTAGNPLAIKWEKGAIVMRSEHDD